MDCERCSGDMIPVLRDAGAATVLTGWRCLRCNPDVKSGVKHDSGKPRWDLALVNAAQAEIDVLTYGAAKYADNGWRTVKPFRQRYFAAAMRHLWAWLRGEDRDPESGLPHLAHARCCLGFLLEQELEQEVEGCGVNGASNE